MTTSKNVFYAFLAIIALSSCAHGGANKHVAALDAGPKLVLQEVNSYRYDYGPVVQATSKDMTYVICDHCVPHSRLTEDTGDQQIIAIPWGIRRANTPSFPPFRSGSDDGARSAFLTALLRSRPTTTPPDVATAPTATVPAAGEQAPIITASTDTAPVQIERAPAASVPQPEEVEIVACNEPPVHFELNSDALKPEAIAQLNSSLPNLRKASDVKVKGYTCDIGTKEYNNKLALRRAKSVAKYLSGHGVAVSGVSGEGKCCYVSEDKPKNRRAEISCRKPKGEVK